MQNIHIFGDEILEDESFETFESFATSETFRNFRLHRNKRKYRKNQNATSEKFENNAKNVFFGAKL
jgi:hypothetical protein